jgi:hypothetical protein
MTLEYEPAVLDHFARQREGQDVTAQRRLERQPCDWALDDVGGDGVWETQCGNAFQFNDGGPTENKALFCCYCGGVLREVRTSEPEAEGR